jgi:purine nucleosidase
MPRKIIIDTDPGIDDSMAILAAFRSPELEILGLTTVFGNTDVEHCSLNALRLVEIAGKDGIPVCKGADRPLILPDLELGTHVHGLDGMGNTNPPPPKGKRDPRRADEFIIQMVKQHPGEVTLVPLGPLTNISLAFQRAPEIESLVDEIVLMGGNAYAPGNISPAAEANIYHDPHAAEIVFRSEWPVTMIGLDATTKILIRPEKLTQMYAADNPAVRLLQRIQPAYQTFHDQIYELGGAFHLHDPSVTAYLIRPELFKLEKAPIYVALQGRAIGKTIPDHQRIWGDRSPTKFAVDADADAVVDLLIERLSK